MAEVYFKAKNKKLKVKEKEEKPKEKLLKKKLKEIEKMKKERYQPPIVDPFILERQYALRKYVDLPKSTLTKSEREREKRELSNYMKELERINPAALLLPSGISGIHRYTLEKQKKKNIEREAKESKKAERERIRGAVERIEEQFGDLAFVNEPPQSAQTSAPASAPASPLGSPPGTPQSARSRGRGFNFDDMHPALQGGLLGHDTIHTIPHFASLRHHANKMLLNLAEKYGKPIHKELVSKLVNHGKTISNIHPAITEGFKNVLSKVQGGSFFEDIKNKLGDFILKYNPLTMMVKHSISKGMEARKQRS
jgi:hypothetical protein